MAAQLRDPDSARRLGREHRGPCAIGSCNAGAPVKRVMRGLADGEELLDAIVAGIKLAEDDPEDPSVGYGGFPNAAGTVVCDAAVMDGRTHQTGAVASLEGIRHASEVALHVLRHCEHSFLVGPGALAFARERGFAPEDLLTDFSRLAYRRWIQSGRRPLDLAALLRAGEQKWKSHTSDPTDTHGAGPAVQGTTGTIHISALNAAGDLASCTSTSGMAWSRPGRVGDSPIIGAGLYTDSAVGSAGATGRGESALETCAAFNVVRFMEDGLEPTDACLKSAMRIAEHTHDPRLLDRRGRPMFNVTLYALRKDGAFGSAAIWDGYSHAVDGRNGAMALASAFLWERERADDRVSGRRSDPLRPDPHA